MSGETEEKPLSYTGETENDDGSHIRWLFLTGENRQWMGPSVTLQIRQVASNSHELRFTSCRHFFSLRYFCILKRLKKKNLKEEKKLD